MKYWKPAGLAALEYTEWRIQRDWATGNWDIYHDGAIVAEGIEQKTDAIAEAERMMDERD